MNSTSHTSSKNREFTLTDKEFEKLTGLIRGLTGIVLGDHKKEMLYGRLARRLRQLGMQSFAQYCDLLDSQKADTETGFLVNAVTTNLTKFFRESHHFDFLKEHLGNIQKDPARRAGDQTVRIWSAGCSSGEEPYSIATTMLSVTPTLCQWNTKILATDLDTNMLATGRSGIYPDTARENIPDEFKKVFDNNSSRKTDKIHMSDRARELVHFKQLNLLNTWPMKKKYDVIFCRNVLIYFDRETKENLVNRYVELLRPGGMLFLGHSESLQTKIDNLTLIGRTSYRKEG